MLVSYLPVGSEQADKFYAQCAIDAGVAFVNALPVFIASDPAWAAKFEAAGVPVIGDDIKSQVGATAGIILVGCCPSGLASNVMSYLARANLALSVSVTTVSTLLAPFLTPLLMRLLGGSFVQIDFWGMVWDITKIVILPIAAGLAFHLSRQGKISMA